MVGFIIALQLSRWKMSGHFLEMITAILIQSGGISLLTLRRLRALHTDALSALRKQFQSRRRRSAEHRHAPQGACDW